MRYLLDSSPYSFQVTRAAEARKDFGKDVQKVDRDTGQPQWVVEVLAQDDDREDHRDQRVHVVAQGALHDAVVGDAPDVDAPVDADERCGGGEQLEPSPVARQ